MSLLNPTYDQQNTRLDPFPVCHNERFCQTLIRRDVTPHLFLTRYINGHTCASNGSRMNEILVADQLGHTLDVKPERLYAGFRCQAEGRRRTSWNQR